MQFSINVRLTNCVFNRIYIINAIFNMTVFSSSALQTQYELNHIVERQCSYCAYNFYKNKQTLLDLLSSADSHQLSEDFIAFYNNLILNSSMIKLRSPNVSNMETFNSEFSQKSFGVFPEIKHIIFNESNLEEYEQMHDYYRMQFDNWQEVHEKKLSTQRISENLLRTLLLKESDFIINRFFMTFYVTRVGTTFIVFDSHYKKVLKYNIDQLLKYIKTDTTDYNLVLFGIIKN